MVRIALGTALILLIPLTTMKFTNDVNWRLNDFIVASVLLFAAGLALDLIVSKIPGKNKFIALGVLIVAFLYIWAELAVGIFTHWGS